MKIHKLYYKDHAQQWEIKEMDFFDLTLLVGVSGVGKTQILTAILNLQKIASGESFNGVEWKVTFSIKKQYYSWSGQFETLAENRSFEDVYFRGEQYKLLVEKLFLNKEVIIERSNQDLFFGKEKMPKLSFHESIISIFKGETDVSPAYFGFKNIVFRDHTIKQKSEMEIYDLENENLPTIESIRNSYLDTANKLFYTLRYFKHYFKQIIESYQDVFPQIENVKMEVVPPPSYYSTPTAFTSPYLLKFKERKTKKWIPQNQMSSGMFRTFLHIAEMYLLADGTVVLIDEFENSLGVNCINVLTEDLIYENSRLQFIATSHHPYIINKIPYEYWKIVTRSGGTIETQDAKDFDLGESSHDRFMNLINLPQYKSGIKSIA